MSVSKLRKMYDVALLAVIFLNFSSFEIVSAFVAA